MLEIEQNHKMQLRSAYMEGHLIKPVTIEDGEYVEVIHDIRFRKTLYRKIELLAQLKDISFLGCLIELAERQLDIMLENKEEMGALISKRILEEAYGVSSVSDVVRPKELQEAIEKEKQKE